MRRRSRSRNSISEVLPQGTVVATTVVNASVKGVIGMIAEGLLFFRGSGGIMRAIKQLGALVN